MGDKKSESNTLVLDQVKGYGLEYVKEPKGHQWGYKGKSVFLMKRVYAGGDPDGTLESVELPQKMGQSPKKLFRALFWDKEAAVLFTLQNLLLEKFKVVGMYVLIGVLLFTIYLIFTSI